MPRCTAAFECASLFLHVGFATGLSRNQVKAPEKLLYWCWGAPWWRPLSPMKSVEAEASFERLVSMPELVDAERVLPPGVHASVEEERSDREGRRAVAEQHARGSQVRGDRLEDEERVEHARARAEREGREDEVHGRAVEGGLLPRLDADVLRRLVQRADEAESAIDFSILGNVQIFPPSLIHHDM